MKPVINSHLDYRRFLNGIGGMYRINWRSKPPAIREIYLRFRELDLSAVDRIMQDQYSSRGAEPRPPSCMLRSLLLMIVMNVVSVTHWFETLARQRDGSSVRRQITFRNGISCKRECFQEQADDSLHFPIRLLSQIYSPSPTIRCTNGTALALVEGWDD